MIRMHIQAIPASNNVYQGKGGKGKAIRDYQKEKKLWAEWIWVMRNNLRARGELEGHELPLQEATVILFYHFKSHTRRDPDNYSGKMVMDGLVANHFLADDSFKEIEIFPMADFGNSQDSLEIFVIKGKIIGEIVRKYIEGERGFDHE